MSDDDYESDNNSVGSDDGMTGGAKKKLAKPAIIQKKTMDYDDDEEEDDSDPEDEDEDEDEDFVPNDVDETDKKKIAGVVVDSDVDEYDDDDDDEDEDDEDEDDTEKPKKKAAVVKAPIAVIPQVIGSDDEDEDNEDDDENYLQKFDIDVNRNYINEFHPECVSHNYDEISKMSNVIRDDNGIIVDPLHMTIPFLTKYERARVLGQRAKQIETGSKPLVKVPENIIDGYLIAEIELEQKKIPFIIRRPLPNGGSEYWRLSDLQIIAF
jgi:DNA-directed RNA polymerase I, II, and III subunit RPABC2